MSGYPSPINNYPHPNLHSTGEGNDPLPQHHHQHQHHGIANMAQPYTYEEQLPQQQYQPQPQIYNNGHTNEQAEDMQLGGPPVPDSGSKSDEQKSNRLRKACDSCSVRKVKCDESGPPCRACYSLDIPCTFSRPSRRRGPPNRHAEAIKKRRLESPPGTGDFSSPTSPNNVAATLASFSSHAVLNAESICPFSILELLVDDFFTYIHPLAPFPHEPSFRAAFKHREDLNNPLFLSLLASMVGVLVASFPRKPRLHLKAQRLENLFPSSFNLVERCHKVAVEARGAGYLDKDLSVYDAATSYFLGLASAYTFQWRQTRLYFGETLNIVRVLGAHKQKEQGFLPVGGLQPAFGAENVGFEQQPVDYIRQEIGRRVFWIMFVGVRSMQQLGATCGELLIPPPTPNEPYPPLPLEVDDEYIYVDHVDPQPPGVVSKLTGFNFGVNVYATLTPLATMEMAYGIDEVFDWNRQKRVLGECLQAVKRVLDDAPQELLLLPSSKAGEFESEISDKRNFQFIPEFPVGRSKDNEIGQFPAGTQEARRQVQFEIQKANIYASQLGTRSYIVEKYWSLHEAYDQLEFAGRSSDLRSPSLLASGLEGIVPKASATSGCDVIETNVAQERENIVKDLLKVLGSISQVNIEPNGGSFINKIRQIASTLIDTKETRKGPVAMKGEEYLAQFLDILMKLERVIPGTGQNDTGVGIVDEEDELRNWADLRQYQMRFAQSGGFLNEI